MTRENTNGSTKRTQRKRIFTPTEASGSRWPPTTKASGTIIIFSSHSHLVCHNFRFVFKFVSHLLTSARNQSPTHDSSSGRFLPVVGRDDKPKRQSRFCTGSREGLPQPHKQKTEEQFPGSSTDGGDGPTCSDHEKCLFYLLCKLFRYSILRCSAT
jgi:hypothetical protein